VNLASLNRCPEDVGVLPIVIPELELGDIQVQILFADLVERPDDAALQNRPKAFDGLCVDRADDVLASAIINGAMVVTLIGECAQSSRPARARPDGLMRAPKCRHRLKAWP
jgi:hypothetical protein